MEQQAQPGRGGGAHPGPGEGEGEGGAGGGAGGGAAGPAHRDPGPHPPQDGLRGAEEHGAGLLVLQVTQGLILAVMTLFRRSQKRRSS